MARWRARSAVAILALAGLAACGSQDSADPGEQTPGTATGTPGAATEAPSFAMRCELDEIPPYQDRGEPTEPQLRQELLDMFADDQAERSGEVAANNDAERTDRLREIIDEHGWPTPALVDKDGATAAWLIAQHSDFDVEFQREALDLMCAAVAAGDADSTELAYLEDRVAVNLGEPQYYGTQVDGCAGGRAAPRPIADEERVHERREHVGLQPLDDYLAIFENCAGPGG